MLMLFLSDIHWQVAHPLDATRHKSIKSNQIKYRLLQSIEDCLNNVITLYNNIDAKGLREASLLNPKPFINTNKFNNYYYVYPRPSTDELFIYNIDQCRHDKQKKKQMFNV